MSIDLRAGLGGGGLPINSVLPLNFEAPIYVEKSGSTWLKTGFIETDVTLYPDAKYDEFIGGYSGFSIDTQNETSGAGLSLNGISHDDSNIWVSDSVTLHLYDKVNGSYITGYTTSIQVRDIDIDGSFIWILDENTSTVHKYNKADITDTGFSFSVAAQESSCRGLCVDDNYVWIVGSGNDTIYKYNKSDGTYTGVSQSVATQDLLPRSLDADENFIWMVGGSSSTVYKYNKSDLSYTGYSYDVSAQDQSVTCITIDGTSSWVGGSTVPDTIYKYDSAIGIASEKTDTETGLTYYLKVK